MSAPAYLRQDCKVIENVVKIQRCSKLASLLFLCRQLGTSNEKVVKKTKEFYESRINEFVVVGKRHFGDKEELTHLLQNYKIYHKNTIDSDSFILLMMMSKKDIKFYSRCVNLIFPTVWNITLFLTEDQYGVDKV